MLVSKSSAKLQRTVTLPGALPVSVATPFSLVISALGASPSSVTISHFTKSAIVMSSAMVVTCAGAGRVVTSVVASSSAWDETLSVLTVVSSEPFGSLGSFGSLGLGSSPPPGWGSSPPPGWGSSPPPG